MTIEISPDRLLVLLGLAFFFGLAFEEQYGASPMKPPGGIRTFPLLAFAGAGLYAVEPRMALPFAAGALALGAWLLAYYRAWLDRTEWQADIGAEVIVSICNMLAYLLGPIVLAGPLWVGIGLTVVAVILLGARQPLHQLARRIPYGELVTLGKFLILTGIVLPLLPDKSVTALTPITPYQAGLAVVAVSGVSYCSYLLQRLASPRHGGLLAAFLGGLYSSTATTAVLARRAREEANQVRELQAGIVLATAVMYLRIWVIVVIFNATLARALLPAMLTLSILALALAGLICLQRSAHPVEPVAASQPPNPLELNTALIFATLFVVVSLVSGWVYAEFSQAGLYGLAAVVGVTDIDPFVLSIAQGSVTGSPVRLLAIAVLIAASSNNLLKAAYAVGLGGYRMGTLPAGGLVVLGVAGLALAMAPAVMTVLG